MYANAFSEIRLNRPHLFQKQGMFKIYNDTSISQKIKEDFFTISFLKAKTFMQRKKSLKKQANRFKTKLKSLRQCYFYGKFYSLFTCKSSYRRVYEE